MVAAGGGIKLDIRHKVRKHLGGDPVQLPVSVIVIDIHHTQLEAINPATFLRPAVYSAAT